LAGIARQAVRVCCGVPPGPRRAPGQSNRASRPLPPGLGSNHSGFARSNTMAARPVARRWEGRVRLFTRRGLRLDRALSAQSVRPWRPLEAASAVAMTPAWPLSTNRTADPAGGRRPRGDFLGCQQTIHFEALLPFEKCQLPLILQGLRIAFQAAHEGSIPLHPL
jgi:hypothetical protein